MTEPSIFFNQDQDKYSKKIINKKKRPITYTQGKRVIKKKRKRKKGE